MDRILPATRIKQTLQPYVKTAGSTVVQDQTLQARAKTAGSTVEERRFQRRVSHPELKRALAPEVGKLSTGNWPLGTGHCLYERTMNSTCGKNSHTHAPSPSLLRIQPMVFLS